MPALSLLRGQACVKLSMPKMWTLWRSARQQLSLRHLWRIRLSSIQPTRASGITASLRLRAVGSCLIAATWTAIRLWKGEARNVCEAERDAKGLEATIWY